MTTQVDRYQALFQMKRIKESKDRLLAAIEAGRKELNALQEMCPHQDHQRTPRSDTGNWDRSQDEYWYDCRCDYCGKIWKEPQR